MFLMGDYELKEIAQNIVNQGVINNLNYEVENISDGVNNFRIEKYCERESKEISFVWFKILVF